MQFKIPKQIQIMGQTIKVRHFKKLPKSEALGEAWYQINEIRLTKYDKDENLINKDQCNVIYWHEVIHHIMANLNREDLRKDEVLIDQIAGLVYQAIKTSK